MNLLKKLEEKKLEKKQKVEEKVQHIAALQGKDIDRKVYKEKTKKMKMKWKQIQNLLKMAPGQRDAKVESSSSSEEDHESSSEVDLSDEEYDMLMKLQDARKKEFEEERKIAGNSISTAQQKKLDAEKKK